MCEGKVLIWGEGGEEEGEWEWSAWVKGHRLCGVAFLRCPFVDSVSGAGGVALTFSLWLFSASRKPYDFLSH